MKVPLVSENIQYFLNEIVSIDCPRCSLGFVLYRCSNNSSGPCCHGAFGSYRRFNGKRVCFRSLLNECVGSGERASS